MKQRINSELYFIAVKSVHHDYEDSPVEDFTLVAGPFFTLQEADEQHICHINKVRYEGDTLVTVSGTVNLEEFCEY